jgi:hypothetical protein
VYVRIPGKGITLHPLLWDDDDDTSERGIGNGLNLDNQFDLIKSGMEDNSERGNGY